jgi:HK97 family phage prohead protease
VRVASINGMVETRVEIESDAYRYVALSDLTVRADPSGDDPHFEGWACRHGVIDAYGTEFSAGCWAAGGLDNEPYALCWMHDPTTPVGVFRAQDQSEGLWIRGWWDDTRDGQDARTKGNSGSAPELSVGFRQAIFDEDEPNRIVAVKLVEVSQITARMAAVPGSQLTTARSAPATGRAVAAARLRLRTVSLGGRL